MGTDELPGRIPVQDEHPSHLRLLPCVIGRTIAGAEGQEGDGSEGEGGSGEGDGGEGGGDEGGGG